MNELKPCPFCGGEAEMDTIERYDGANIFFVKCTTCQMTMPLKSAHSEAIAAWNRRTQPENKPLTNADRIRSMSDEELAKTLTDDDFFYEEICGSDKRTRVCDNDCVVCVLEWLWQPAKEEHHEVD